VRGGAISFPVSRFPFSGLLMTVLSCLAIGFAFLIAVGLLVFAGTLIGWVIPRLLERSRRKEGRGGPNRD